MTASAQTRSETRPEDRPRRPTAARPAPRRTRGYWVALVVGLGLFVAPAVFQMFDRAPLGGEMIDEFRPYMTEQKLGSFSAHLDRIDAADHEIAQVVPAASQPSAVARLHDEWPTIQDDMGGMLAVMRDNLDNFAAVDALPPFPLFPWFFVAPAVLVVVAAARGLRSTGRGPAVALIAVGVGLLAAPALFQMFERAPKGGQMLDELGPYMDRGEVGAIQGYFVTLGAAEGAIRNDVLPSAQQPLAATEEFVARWPSIANEMAPMVGVMADNLDNFAAVDALPPFPLFPWFFVAPGLIVAASGAVALRATPEEETR